MYYVLLKNTYLYCLNDGTPKISLVKKVLSCVFQTSMLTKWILNLLLARRYTSETEMHHTWLDFVILSCCSFLHVSFSKNTGVSFLGVPGLPWHPQILAGQLTLSLLGGTDYAHLITTGTSGFSDLPTALSVVRSGIYMIYHIKK